MYELGSDASFPFEIVLGGKLEPLVGAPIEELAERLSRAAARRDVFAGLAAFGPSDVVRRTLHRSPELELVLSCWLPGQGTPAHDHGRARGAAAVVFGELVETRYRAAGPLAVPEREAAVGPLGTILERPAGIHRVENRTRRPAVSLHLYVPGLTMRAWPTTT